MGFKRILDECSFATFSGRACEAGPLSGYAENILEGYLSRVRERLNVVRAEPDNFISRLIGSAECARTEDSARRVGVETKVSVGWLVRSLAHDQQSLAQMREAAKDLAVPDAAERVLVVCAAVVEEAR